MDRLLKTERQTCALAFSTNRLCSVTSMYRLIVKYTNVLENDTAGSSLQSVKKVSAFSADCRNQGKHDIRGLVEA